MTKKPTQNSKDVQDGLAIVEGQTVSNATPEAERGARLLRGALLVDQDHEPPVFDRADSARLRQQLHAAIGRAAAAEPAPPGPVVTVGRISAVTAGKISVVLVAASLMLWIGPKLKLFDGQQGSESDMVSRDWRLTQELCVEAPQDVARRIHADLTARGLHPTLLETDALYVLQVRVSLPVPALLEPLLQEYHLPPPQPDGWLQVAIKHTSACHKAP